MTGIPAIDNVIDFLNFLRVIARVLTGIGMAVSGIFLLNELSGFRFFTPSYDTWNRNWMGIWIMWLLGYLLLWFVLGQFQPRVEDSL